MSYSIKFRINLLNYGSKEDLTLIHSRSIYLPIGMKGSCPSFVGKHGDTFILHGLHAGYVKNLVTNGLILHVELDDAPADISDIPDVENLGLFSDGLELYAEWLASDYSTQIEYRINDGSWISISPVEAGIGSVSL